MSLRHARMLGMVPFLLAVGLSAQERYALNFGHPEQFEGHWRILSPVSRTVLRWESSSLGTGLMRLAGSGNPVAALLLDHTSEGGGDGYAGTTGSRGDAQYQDYTYGIDWIAALEFSWLELLLNVSDNESRCLVARFDFSHTSYRLRLYSDASTPTGGRSEAHLLAEKVLGGHSPLALLRSQAEVSRQGDQVTVRISLHNLSTGVLLGALEGTFPDSRGNPAQSQLGFILGGLGGRIASIHVEPAGVPRPAGASPWAGAPGRKMTPLGMLNDAEYPVIWLENFRLGLEVIPGLVGESRALGYPYLLE